MSPLEDVRGVYAVPRTVQEPTLRDAMDLCAELILEIFSTDLDRTNLPSSSSERHKQIKNNLFHIAHALNQYPKESKQERIESIKNYKSHNIANQIMGITDLICQCSSIEYGLLMCSLLFSKDCSTEMVKAIIHNSVQFRTNNKDKFRPGADYIQGFKELLLDIQQKHQCFIVNMQDIDDEGIANYLSQFFVRYNQKYTATRSPEEIQREIDAGIARRV